jgi:hypothetical protein
MSAIQPPKGLSVEDFETIESAVAETARGRWFLAEFARRTRGRETDKMLAALERLEHVMAGGPPQIAPARDPRLAEALAAVCERLRDIAWTLRDRGVDASLYRAVESEAHIIARLQMPAEVLLERLAGIASVEPPKMRSSSLTERIESLRPPPLTDVAPQTPAPAAVLPEASARPGISLADIDALPFREKLLFFA